MKMAKLLVYLWTFPLQKNVAALFISATLLLLILFLLPADIKKKNCCTKGLQSFLEPLILFVVDDG